MVKISDTKKAAIAVVGAAIIVFFIGLSIPPTQNTYTSSETVSPDQQDEVMVETYNYTNLSIGQKQIVTNVIEDGNVTVKNNQPAFPQTQFGVIRGETTHIIDRSPQKPPATSLMTSLSVVLGGFGLYLWTKDRREEDLTEGITTYKGAEPWEYDVDTSVVEKEEN